jgi:hypothetical protein
VDEKAVTVVTGNRPSADEVFGLGTKVETCTGSPDVVVAVGMFFFAILETRVWQNTSNSVETDWGMEARRVVVFALGSLDVGRVVVHL